MLLLGTRNTLTQTVAAGSPITIGDVYRRYCKKNECGMRTFDTTSNAVALQQSGVYLVNATVVFTADTAGDVVLQLTQNGTPIPGAIATATVTTAETEINTLPINFFVLVDSTCVLGAVSTAIQNIGVINNSTVDITVTNYVLDIVKVV